MKVLRLVMAGMIGLASAPVASVAPVAADLQLAGTLTQGGVATGIAPATTVALRLGDQLIPVDADGRFLIAFDRDAAPAARLSARLADGRTIERC